MYNLTNVTQSTLIHIINTMEINSGEITPESGKCVTLCKLFSAKTVDDDEDKAKPFSVKKPGSRKEKSPFALILQRTRKLRFVCF